MKNILLLLPFLILLSCGGQDKSKLEASVSVAIEMDEQLQLANIDEFAKGINERYMFYFEAKLDAEINGDSPLKEKYWTILLNQIDNIDSTCSNLILLIENIKIELLKGENENIAKIENKEKQISLWGNYENEDAKKIPTLNLRKVKNKYSSEFVNSCLVNNDPKTLTPEGKKLWDGLNKYRNKLVNFAGSYNNIDEIYSVNVHDINTFKNEKDLKEKVQKMISESNADKYEDSSFLVQMYIQLTKPEYITYNNEKVQWVNATFKDLPLVVAISRLTSLENEITKARTTANSLIFSKMCINGYGFNKIVPLTSGPTVIKEGEELKIKIALGALDTYKRAVVTVQNPAAQIKYDDGFGIITLKPKKGLQTLKGTISIKNKAGVYNPRPWEWTVDVVDEK